MSTSPSHPAYYTSRRQLWATLPNNGDNLCSRWFRRMGFGNNITTLFSVWYSLVAVGTVVFLTANAIWRYQEFKAQAYNPRYGGRWNEITPLHLQLGVLIFSLSCFPVLIYAIVSKTGHSANDSISLGLDIPHLQRSLFACPLNQQSWKTLNNIPTEMQPLNGDTLPRTRNGSHTPEIDTNLSQLLIKRRSEDWVTDALECLRPFSTAIFVIMTYACLFPVCVLEAEQLRNEVMDPRYVYQSNLDSIFGRHAFTSSAGHRERSKTSVGKPEIPSLIHTADSASLIVIGYSDDQPLPTPAYAVTPSSVSLEYTAFTVTLAFLTVQYAAPFFFTSRSFSLVFTFYTALSGFFLAVDAATMAVVYKMATVGHRLPGGWRQADTTSLVLDKHISPLGCLFISAACVPIVLSNLAAIYSYGYEQFTRALVNYAQLLVSGDLLAYVKRPVISEGSVISKDSCNGMTAANDPATVSTDERAYATTGLPVAIAVTTKYWRRPSSGRLSGREQTPTPGQHYPSNASEISMTLKRNRPSGNGSYDPNGSVHTLSGGKDLGKAKVDRKWRHFRQLSVASVTFFAFLITRICLAGPLIRCYWKTGLRLALVDIVFSVLYMVTWLLIWFGLGVKSAWRFRLLHSAILNWSLSQRRIGSELASSRIHSDKLHNLQQQQQQYLQNAPQLAYAGGYWPYLTYPQWIPTDQPTAAEGLTLGGVGDSSRIGTPLVNGTLAGVRGVNSVHDSLYGCFPEGGVSGGEEHQPSSSQPNNYQVHDIGLRGGPPTVSDDSELPATVDDNPVMGTTNYFHPIPGTAGKTQINSSLYAEQQQQQFSASNLPFIGSVSNQPFESSSQDTSPIEQPSPHVMNKGARQKGSKVSAALSLLQQRQYNAAKAGEPTYATLANPSVGNQIRPPSADSYDADKRVAQSSTAPFHHSVTSKRGNSRVTFRDPNRITRATVDVTTGSSDSGVYTNGNISNQYSASLFDRQPSRPGNLKPENLAVFTRSHEQTSPRNDQSTPGTLNSQKYNFNPNQTLNGTCLDENEISTDFTGQHRLTSDNGLYTSQKMETTLSESNDHLCSQV